MLCQFTFKNYNSYKNETVFDMQAVSGKSFEESLLRSGNDGMKFLPVSAIYGPNAGGKSNLLKALNCAISLVVNPILVFKNNAPKETDIELAPFLFDDISQNEPTEFELYFRPDDEYEYRYALKLINEKITEESLYRRKTTLGGKRVKIFERGPDGITLGACLKKVLINTEVNDQMPYLSFLYINYKLEPVARAVRWFEKCIRWSYAIPYADRRYVLLSNNKNETDFKKKLVDLMNDAGINISDYIIESKSDIPVKILFEHSVNGNKYTLNILQESDGTQKLFNALQLVIIALSEGRLLVIDELDAKLHPKLLKFIIMLFKNPEINTKGAQLIFTSHDVSTMKSSVFRTDEIWFACKLEDESSDLYSLYEIRDENGNHIQPDAAFGKQYLEGRYGADPYFQNMMEWK